MDLENGLAVNVYDCSRRYYGDFHLVRLEVICSVPVEAKHVEGRPDSDAVLRELGPVVEYRRILERMGVPGSGVDSAKEELWRDFLKTSLPYMSQENFPKKYILHQLGKKKGCRPGK
jgi:hypothetical protein